MTLQMTEAAVSDDSDEPRKCIGCGYILEHLPHNRCPECGLEFDPHNLGTFEGGDPALRGRRPTTTRVMIFVVCLGTLGFGVLYALYLMGKYALEHSH